MIEYRLLQTAAELLPLIRIQAETWRLDADLEDVVPVHQLLTAAKYGGMIIGAFDREQMAGFAYGFVGLYQGRPMLCSHMLAVLPPYRGRGLGAALKLEQRRVCLDSGLNLMHWTYDPLEALNARLNIARLGAICRQCLPNLYGEMRDGLNAGLPSDRFVAEWHLDGRRAQAAAERKPIPGTDSVQGAIALNQPETPPGEGALPEASALAIFIPRSFQQVKQHDPSLALHWRLSTRQAFHSAFAGGYVVTDFQEGAYILTRREELIL